MKVLLVTRKFPPSVGGMQLYAYDLHQALSGKIATVLVKWGGSNKALPVVYPMLFLRGWYHLAKGGIDVIHLLDGTLAPLGWLLSKISRKPFTVEVHGLDFTFANPIYQAVVPRAARRAAVVFCNSAATAEVVASRGLPRSKLVVLPHPVRDNLHGKAGRAGLIKRLELAADCQVLLTVGRLVERKGVAWFIQAVMPDLVNEFPNLIYLVVGEGPEHQAIEAAIADSGLTRHVRLLGRVTDELYEAVYNGANVFVMPNINVPNNIEGFGVVALEAALCELPIVASKTEGIVDAVIHGENGMLVPVRDASAFKHHIGAFLKQPESARQFGRQARSYTLKHYRWETTVERYLEVFNHLAKRP